MKNKMVVKSNLLVEASYKLSAQEQWVILTLTSMIKNNDEDFADYSFSIKEFANLAGIRHKGEYEDVRKITQKLIGRVFTIKEPSGPLQLAWLSSAKYIDGKGIVILRFDPNLKPYLMQLKECFTKYSLHIALSLKSSFSIRIYELLKQYEKLKERTFFLKELKEMVGVLGDQYKLYGHFKAKVLKVAQEELAEKTDIAFDYEEIKIGRSVGKIRFIIRTQAVTKKTFPLPGAINISSTDEKKVELETPELLKLFDLVPQEFRKEGIKRLIKFAFEQNGFDYVMRNLVYTNEKSNAVNPFSNLEKGSNYRVYLSKALQADYGLTHQEDHEAKKERKEKHRKISQEEDQKKAAERAEILIDQENRAKARVYLESLTLDAIKTLEEKAKSRMTADSLTRLAKQNSVATFEFKRKIEEIVMEIMGLRKPDVEEKEALEVASLETQATTV